MSRGRIGGVFVVWKSYKFHFFLEFERRKCGFLAAKFWLGWRVQKNVFKNFFWKKQRILILFQTASNFFSAFCQKIFSRVVKMHFTCRWEHYDEKFTFSRTSLFFYIFRFASEILSNFWLNVFSWDEKFAFYVSSDDARKKVFFLKKSKIFKVFAGLQLIFLVFGEQFFSVFVKSAFYMSKRTFWADFFSGKNHLLIFSRTSYEHFLDIY